MENDMKTTTMLLPPLAGGILAITAMMALADPGHDLSGFDGWLMALYGMPLESPRPLTDTVLLGPARPADLFVDVVAQAGETAYLVRVDNGEVFVQTAFQLMSGAYTALANMVDALPPNPNMGTPDLA
ncbi:hypothetical protein [Rhodophyticola porphyridii]|uniref:Uncharacterized protein n=1 Tax=Rhodophyticola porphyridii TaxID=1852017 RepID=A0A3L9Y3D5_9RHOB|nr:hypothetical protein [Rhodophyticola porphyridii]RMA40606.1 hypothetical protein D9R08_18800 [Rhodophyticola porphyridii]